LSALCPNCKRGKLIELQDANPKIMEYVCPICGYYNSNSEAFALYPYLFQGLGRTILLELKNKLSAHGLNEAEAQAWLNEEPAFTRQIVSPIDDRRKVTALPDRRRGTTAVPGSEDWSASPSFLDPASVMVPSAAHPRQTLVVSGSEY